MFLCNFNETTRESKAEGLEDPVLRVEWAKFVCGGPGGAFCERFVIFLAAVPASFFISKTINQITSSGPC